MNTVYVYLNEQDDEDGRHAAWAGDGYQHGHKMVPAISWVETELTELMDILNFSFSECGNNPAGGAIRDQWIGLEHRSLSVGDGVKISTDEESKYFVVESKGWLEVIPWDVSRVQTGSSTRISENQRTAIRNIPTRENRVTTSRTKLDLSLTRVKNSDGENVTGLYTYQGYMVRGILRFNAYDKYDFEYWVIEDHTGIEVGRTQTLKDARYWLAQSS